MCFLQADKELEEDVRGGYLMGLVRRLTCWSPLVAALYKLNKRKALITAEKVGYSVKSSGLGDDNLFRLLVCFILPIFHVFIMNR